MNHVELAFSEEPYLYNYPADIISILSKDESKVFLYIRKLFQDPDFIRVNQRDWLEILYNANVVIQDRKLGLAY